MKSHSLEDIKNIVEFHLHNNEQKNAAWEKAAKVYNAKNRDGLPDSVKEDEAIARNLAYETADALSSTLVPRNPQLKISPKRDDLGDAANAQEGLVSEAFLQGDLESKFKKAVTLASIQDYSVLKTVWKGRKKRPVYRAIAAKNIFFDPHADTWDDITYIGEITVLTLAEIKQRSKRKQGRPSYKRAAVELLHGTSHLPEWLQTDGMDGKTPSKLRELLGQRVVVELIIFDPEGGQPRLLHVVPKQVEPLLDIKFPYRYMRNPYTLLSELGGLALEGITGTAPYELIRALGVHLNQLESTRAAVAKASIPTPILNKAELQNPDAFLTAYKHAADPRDMVEIELASKVPLSDVLMFSQTPGTTIDFQQAITAIESRIDSTLGLPSYLRAGNSGADFSAEIQLQSHELATRSGARRKVILDAVIDIGLKTLQLYAEYLGEDDTVYVRAAEGEVPSQVNREIAALQMFADRAGEMPLELDFQVRVVDEATENPVVRLQAVQPFMEMLMMMGQSGLVDIGPIVVQLLRWLGLEKGIPDKPQAPEEAQAAAQTAVQGGQPGGPNVPGVSGGQSGVGEGSGGASSVNLPAST